jgi:hypothetical protein
MYAKLEDFSLTEKTFSGLFKHLTMDSNPRMLR